jgi:hypothetical protein
LTYLESRGRIHWVIVALGLVLLFLALTVKASSSEASTGKWGEEVNMDRGESPFIQVANGRNPVQFIITVNVVTNREYVSCNAQFTERPDDWWNIFIATPNHTSTHEGEFTFMPDEPSWLSVTITAPFYQLNDTYRFVLRLSIADNPLAFDEVNMSVVIPQKAGFVISLWNPPPGGEFQAIPPSIMSIRFALYNTGNGFDNFLVRGRVEPADTDWRMEFVSGTDQDGLTPRLPSDWDMRTPHFIDIKVIITPEGRAGETAQVIINVTSMFDPFLVKPAAFASISALQQFGFEAQVDGPRIQEGIPGSEVEFLINIHNTGNGFDTFTVKSIWDTELNPGFVAGADPRTLDIDVNETVSVKYIVKVPSFAHKTLYYFRAEVKSSSPELAPVTLMFVVEVAQHYKISLSTEDPTIIQTIPGGRSELLITIHNTGNGIDRVTLDLIDGVLDGWEVLVQPAKVSLFRDQKATVKVSIEIPSQLESSSIGFHKLIVHAKSMGGGMTAKLELLLEVRQYHRIAWDLENRYPTSELPDLIYPSRAMNPYERNVTSVDADLMNYGNGVDTVDLTWYSPNPRIELSFDVPAIALEPHETRPIKVNIRVEKTIPPGDYIAYVNATSRLHNSTPEVLPIEIRIDNVDVMVPPIPTYIDPHTGDVVRAELQMNEGSTFPIKLKIENNGTLPVAHVSVRAFDIHTDENGNKVWWNFFNYSTPYIDVGDRFIVGERPFTEWNPPIHWPAQNPGTHTIRLVVYLPYQSDNSNDVSMINITVIRHPPPIEESPEIPIRMDIMAVLIGGAVTFVVAVAVREWIRELKKPLRPW